MAHEADHASGAPSSEPISSIGHDALFVVNGGDNTISVIDTERNELVDTIRLKDASFPHHLYLNADTSQMVLAVPGVDLSMGHSGGAHHPEGAMGAVLLLDASTGATLRARSLAATNHNAIFSPDGQEVWTSQATDSGAVLVLDATTLEVKQRVDVGQGPAEVTFSADGRSAFVANGGSGSVTVIDVDSKTVLDTIEVGQTPVGAWQGSNGIAYVDNEGSKSLTAIDTVSLEILNTYDLGFTPGMAALGPDGEVWVTDADNGAVVLLSASDGSTSAEITTGAGAHGIVFSADGSFAYVSNQSDGTVSVTDVVALNVTATIGVGSRPNGLAWRAH